MSHAVERAEGGNPLQGSWHLVCWDIQYSDGRPATLPFGADATGLLCYTDDGRMSACIARAGRQPLSQDSPRNAPEAERLAAFESYFQYAGRYRLEPKGAGRQVVHEVTHALNPNFVGSRQVRQVDLTPDGRLTLSATDALQGSTVQRHHRLVWERRT